MRCYNCNVNIPDGAAECPSCGAKVRTDVLRCPKCFKSIERQLKTCPNCGCDISKTLAEEERSRKQVKKPVLNRFSEMSARIKAAAVVSFILIAAVVCTALASYKAANAKRFEKYASEYISLSQECMEDIDMLALKYNEVYDGKWLVQMENTQAVEKKYADVIDKIRTSRDRLDYLSGTLKSMSFDEEGCRLAGEVSNYYTKCYLYVVEKHGRYPGYISGYDKISKEYKRSLEDLENHIR